MLKARNDKTVLCYLRRSEFSVRIVILTVNGSLELVVRYKQGLYILCAAVLFGVGKKYFHWFALPGKCYFNSGATPKGVARVFL